MTRFATPFILLVLCTPAFAADWPAWRGPTGQGVCEEKNIPVTWSDKEHVKWKVPLANQGNSTPVIWGDKIFLTQANKRGLQRSLLCFARADGKLLWQKDALYNGVSLIEKLNMSGMPAGTYTLYLYQSDTPNSLRKYYKRGAFKIVKVN